MREEKFVITQHDEFRGGLLQRLANARTQTDKLFNLVRPESMYERPIPERHRIIFYLGHLEAFDLNLLQGRLSGITSFQPAFDRLFAFGIDPVDGGLPADQPADWPSINEVHQYQSRVRETLDSVLAKADFSAISAPLDWDNPSLSFLLNVSIEHRLMHAETFAYMLHQLPFDQKMRQPSIAATTPARVEPKMMQVTGGTVTLGALRSDSNHFGWDNEFDTSETEVPTFEIDECKVTNGQYLMFMAAGGYDDRKFWSEADWQWKTAQNISHPIFWKQAGGRWHFRAMFDEIELPLEWPVYVSQAEASAYARWVGKQLPTEAQWHRAVFGAPEGPENELAGASPLLRRGNFDFQHWNPIPVNEFQGNRSAFGVVGAVGNGWEWTSTLFKPFPGFQPFPFYPGYSADFFDGKHYVAKGGSARTAACMIRPSFRNWFQPHYQYVYAGFRCVSN